MAETTYPKWPMTGAAAGIVGVDTETLRRYARAGKIKAIETSAGLLFRLEDVLALRDSRLQAREKRQVLREVREVLSPPVESTPAEQPPLVDYKDAFHVARLNEGQ